MIQRVCMLLTISTLITFCGKDKQTHRKKVFEEEKQEESLTDNLKTKKASLLFSAVDPMGFPWQATIYQIIPSSQKVTKLLKGESSDPFFAKVDSGILLFNRASDSKNYKLLTQSKGIWSYSSQKTFPSGELGDPHAAIQIAPNRYALAHYTEGSIVVMENGKEIQKVPTNWNIPDKVSLKPDAMVLVKKGTRQFIYVIHQGLTIAQGTMSANNSQKAFVLEVVDGKLIPVNLRTSPSLDQSKINGIPLVGTFPVPFYQPQNNKIILFSLCSNFISVASTTIPCSSVIEELNVSTNTIRILWDLKGKDVYMNGPTVMGKDSNTYFANVEVKKGNKKVKRVMKFQVAEKKFTEVYSFPDSSGGFWGIFYDKSSNRLMVGDVNDATIGKFTFISEDGKTSTVPLDHVPYNGVWMD